VRAAGADVAVQHDVLIARDGIETELDLPQRNVARAFDVPGAPFVRFAESITNASRISASCTGVTSCPRAGLQNPS
jgi:hypothetical protein